MDDDDAPPPLTAAHIDWWRAALAAGTADPGLAPEADAAGIQLLAAALRHGAPGIALDLAGGSAAARLWARLGLDDPLGAVPALAGGRLVGLAPAGGPP